MSSVQAAALTWEEISEAASSGAVALLPVGSTEAHGPHLPLDTDVRIAEEVAKRAQGKLARLGAPAVIFPSLAYGVTEFAAAFPGTVGIRAETLRGLVADVCSSLLGQGFGKVVLVNHHLEPAHFAVLHEVAALFGPHRVVVPDHRRRPVAPTLGEEFCRGGSHAGRYETSLVLAADPSRVRAVAGDLPVLDVDLAQAIRQGAKTFSEIGGDRAYFGDPAGATAEEGDALYDLLSDQVVDLVLEGQG